MPILVFAENLKGKVKKSGFEAVYYSYKLAQQMGTSCHAVTVGKIDNISDLGKYGAEKVHQIESRSVVDFDSQQFGKAVSAIASQIGAKVVV